MSARMTFVILAKSYVQSVFKLPIWQLQLAPFNARNLLTSQQTISLNLQRSEPLVESRVGRMTEGG